MTAKTASNPPIRRRILRSLAANRHHRVHFPGIFMGLAGRTTKDGVVLGFDDGAWCRDACGEVALTPLGVLLDTALGAVTRLHAGNTRQHATVHIEAHFTGASTGGGRLKARSRFMGFSERTALPHGMSRATVAAGGVPVVHASGGFVILDLPPGAPQRPPSWMREAGKAPTTIDLATLEDHERQVLDAYERARAAATPEHAFMDEFWGGGTPRAGEREARLEVPVSAHLGNRVGNVHGGILFGLAARVANAALPRSMRLSNISAWFLSPGQGESLDVRSSVVQHGRNLAVVRTEILGPAGKRVLEATSQHVATGAA